MKDEKEIQKKLTEYEKIIKGIENNRIERELTIWEKEVTEDMKRQELKLTSIIGILEWVLDKNEKFNWN